MPIRIWRLTAPLLVLLIVGPSCETSLQEGDLLPPPDGIDPRNPNVERSTQLVDFTDIRSVRLELPTGRVKISQEIGSKNATIQVTEIIVKQGLGNDLLEEYLIKSKVTAERAFVDDARLDIEATVAEGLTDEDIIYDVRLVVPAGASLEVLVGQGPVEVNALTGNVEIRTKDGSIDIDGVDGNVVAETTVHSVTIKDVTGNVQTKTTEADITLQLTPPADSRISAETTTGTIHMTVAKATAASLRLAAIDGEVNANLSGFQVTDIATSRGLLEGILNGGGGQIEATAMTGGAINFLGMANDN
ncbi:MAG: DUF4097 family beta strand repeat-containing protein [Phycisphaerales bacterium]|nr:DUF4097 family beta strand repeat-containing protein [Phycisphaerales bacterium]